MIRLTRSHWAHGNLAKLVHVLVNFSISILKFCKIAQFFIVSVSLVRSLLKDRGKIFSTYSGPTTEKKLPLVNTKNDDAKTYN